MALSPLPHGVSELTAQAQSICRQIAPDGQLRAGADQALSLLAPVGEQLEADLAAELRNDEADRTVAWKAWVHQANPRSEKTRSHPALLLLPLPPPRPSPHPCFPDPHPPRPSPRAWVEIVLFRSLPCQVSRLGPQVVQRRTDVAADPRFEQGGLDRPPLRSPG